MGKLRVERSGKSAKGVGRTAFVPRIVFRTLFKATIPVLSTGALPACLAVHAFREGGVGSGGAGGTVADASSDVSDVGAGKDGTDTAAGDTARADAADASDGMLGVSDGSSGDGG